MPVRDRCNCRRGHNPWPVHLHWHYRFICGFPARPSEDRTDEHDRPLAPQQCQTSASYAVQPRFCCQTQRRVGHVKANPARQLPSKLRNTYDKNAQKQISDHVTRQIAGRKKTRCQYMEGVSENVPEQKACTQSPVQGRARAYRALAAVDEHKALELIQA